ncbi:DsbA family protein [Phycicoccus sp. Soil803]|uniref:mycothiol-dependent nitroreductase Rv2466c family protein n=1 Tax=Phycicoccus sp. Soil803 TaxID=1736415 RepID=UPI00070C7334|nr:DsbA family protein [Phycicoccus sp. Soil803]KRF23774.1 disulfide bond formation protein DsbA [Phycicoccus sp. Soil803]
MNTKRDTVVDFWFDPVCPYSWTASRWLIEVGRLKRLTVRHHVLSLYLLNQGRTDIAPEYRHNIEASRGPAKVATAVVTRCGMQALADFYTAFGQQVFDVWRRPTSAEYHEAIRAALAEVGLPGELEGAMESEVHDEALRASHDAGVTLVGRGDVGTPITSFDGGAFFGPVLNAIPRGEHALQVFEGARMLAAYPQFFELKRTRLQPPVFT